MRKKLAWAVMVIAVAAFMWIPPPSTAATDTGTATATFTVPAASVDTTSATKNTAIDVGQTPALLDRLKVASGSMTGVTTGAKKKARSAVDLTLGAVEHAGAPPAT